MESGRKICHHKKIKGKVRLLRHAENIPSIHACTTNEINQKKLGKNKETDLKLKDGRNE